MISTVQSMPSTLHSNTSNSQQQLQAAQSLQNQQSIMTEQFKCLSIQSQSSSVTAPQQTQTTLNNKENTKKQELVNSAMAMVGSNIVSAVNGSQQHSSLGQGGTKVSLKPREFGREITNATSSSQSGISNPISVKSTDNQVTQISSQQQQINQQQISSNITSGIPTTKSVSNANQKPVTSQQANSKLSQQSKPVSTFGQGNIQKGHVTQQAPLRKAKTGGVSQTNTVSSHQQTTQNTNLSVGIEQQIVLEQLQPMIKASKFTSQESTESSHHSSEHSSNKSDGKSSEERKSKSDNGDDKKDGMCENVKDKCKERLTQFRKTVLKGMVLSDQLDMRDPQSVAEFAQEIFDSMIQLEKYYRIDNDYLSKTQTEIKDTSRAFLVEWIIDVHRKFRLMPETLYVTINIIDRYLSLQLIKKSELHLLGVTALLISTKYEEIYPPELKDLLSVSENKFSKSEILKMETKILSILSFNFMYPSSLRFLERYRKLSNTASDDQIFYFAQYLNEISLLDSSLLKYKQSELAAASLILSARAIKRINAWNKEMEKCTGFKEEDLKSAIEDVKSFAYEVNPKFLQTLKYKFSKPEYFEVANIPFKF